MAGKKHLAFHNRFANIHNRVIIPGNGGVLMGNGVNPVRRIVHEMSDMMGGLLISDRVGNVAKGGRINRVAPRRPIRFMV